MKTNIPQTTLNKCHSSCWRLLVLIVNNCTYNRDTNEWQYENDLDKICQIIHVKKRDVITQLSILHNDDYIEVTNVVQLDIYERFVQCKVNISLIYK